MSTYVDTSAAALEHCEAMSALYPDLAEQYSSISSLFSRKLWHQLTVEVLKFITSPDTLRTTSEGGSSYLALYDRVVLVADKKMNQLSLARIASAVASSLLDGDGKAAQTVLENLLEKKARLGPAAALFAESKLMLLGLDMMAKSGDGTETESAKKHLEATKAALKRNSAVLAELSADGADLGGEMAAVHSAHYECAMTYRKAVGPPGAFYREAISYLNYTPLDSLTPDNRYALATDISMAALTGEGVFNFGEVVNAPVLSVLEGTENGWLVEMMHASARGDVLGFQKITESHAASIQKQPALVGRADMVKEKITLLALVNMVFERPSSERTLGFDEIAERTQMPKDQVELVIMRALSLGLIKGSMDQVDETVSVTWVMPRVLGKEQLEDLATRFGEWAVKVSKTRDYMGEQTPALA